MSDTGFIYSSINFDEPEPLANKRETILGLVITFMIISWICVVLRLYVRLRIVRAAGLDDLFVGLYLITTTVGSISICMAVDYGLGKHVLLLTPAQITNYVKTYYVSNATYVTSAAFIKLALLLQYYRIFGAGTWIHRAVTGLIIFTSLWGFAYAFIAWVPCIPIQDFWNSLISMEVDGVCYGYGATTVGPFLATYQSHTAINMLLDVLLLLIPLPLFWKEGVRGAHRIRLVVILSMGSTVIALAAWRLATMVEHQVATLPTRDPTWYGPISMLLAALEINAASICASVPIFWPEIVKHWDRRGIFVTQEIQITRESRHREVFKEDDFNSLTKSTTHSRSGSEEELGNVDGYGAYNEHYRDSYILRQVDPLRSRDDRSQPSVTAVPIKDSARKWTKF